MQKHIIDFNVVQVQHLGSGYSLLKLVVADGTTLPESRPGQFVQVKIPGAEHTFLRRPISLNYVDETKGEIWLLVRDAGEGTHKLCTLAPGSLLNLIYPLGNGFTLPGNSSDSLLLVGGGVGVAPLLQLGIVLKNMGFKPEFLLGARSKSDVLELSYFEEVGPVHITTDDGSCGQKGFAVDHTCLVDKKWNRIYCCGPAPMMKSIARKAKEIGADCEVSLENMMACGVGACLCCVENTVKGNVCVCTEGPVFNINQLNWD